MNKKQLKISKKYTDNEGMHLNMPGLSAAKGMEPSPASASVTLVPTRVGRA